MPEKKRNSSQIYDFVNKGERVALRKTQEVNDLPFDPSSAGVT